MAPGNEANGDNLVISFRSSINYSMLSVLIRGASILMSTQNKHF